MIFCDTLQSISEYYSNILRRKSLLNETEYHITSTENFEGKCENFWCLFDKSPFYC